ncbi:MAG TPA: OmpA family protein [Candidatus Aquicultoraceae bacterium]|nr:OmpA family protein [Candidatus Aquicultoraceae bacterium]
MEKRAWYVWLLVVAMPLAALLSGCAGMERVENRRVWYVHRELPAADRAVEAARAAGKDKECPEAFRAAEKMTDEAYEIYWSCRTREAIAKANEATAAANGLCPKKAAPPAPPPPPARLSVSLSASPPVVDPGKCSTLRWESENAASVSLDPGIGEVSPSGSREACPEQTTRYTITAKGEGGSESATTTVTVNPPPAQKVIDRLTLHINFDTNRSEIRSADLPELEKAVAFLKKYPDARVSVEGYTDSRGSEKYNLALSDRRAQAVRTYLVEKGGVSADRITAVGKGEADPVGDNGTEKGRFENRRVEVLVLSR